MIGKTVPANLTAQYGVYISVLASSGVMVVFAMGLGLPAGDYNPALGL